MRNALATYLLIMISFVMIHLIIPYPFPLFIPEWIVMQSTNTQSPWKGIGGLSMLIVLYLQYSTIPAEQIIFIYLAWYLVILTIQRTLQAFQISIQILSICSYILLVLLFQYQAIYGIIQIVNIGITVAINALLFGILLVYRTQNDWLEEFFQK
jgi:hypothetical protein